MYMTKPKVMSLKQVAGQHKMIKDDVVTETENTSIAYTGKAIASLLYYSEFQEKCTGRQLSLL